MNRAIGFVILHYNTIKETIECVESIEKNIDREDYAIVIVDNASPNNSGKILEKRYADSEKVTVILSLQNLGFAKGNNVGYQYCVQKLKCEFVCVLNNDTLIVQQNFFAVIREEYERSKFGVMGPKIILKDGRINYLYYPFPDLQYFENELKIHKREYWQMKWHLNYPIVAFKLTRNRISKLLGRERESRHKRFQIFDHLDRRKEEVVLHGCCLVFSPQYARCYQEAFNPSTFLYKEEELLYLRCKREKLRIVYNPNLVIKHLEDVATNSITRKRRDKIMFWLENQIHSLEVLISVLKEVGANESGKED